MKMRETAGVSQSVLNSKYEKTKINAANKIQDASILAIMIDGWTNINRTGILNIEYTSEFFHYSILEIFWEFNRETGE